MCSSDLLKVPDGNDQELLAIRDAVKGLYSAYGDMYDCTIHVSGNYSTYNSKFNAADSNILSKWKTLNTTLGHLHQIIEDLPSIACHGGVLWRAAWRGGLHAQETNSGFCRSSL